MSYKLNIKKIVVQNKSIRFPQELINEIKKETTKNNICFSEFVIQACEFALANIKEKKQK